VSETVNIHETDGGSVTVGLPDFSFEDTRRQLIATRVTVGAKTPRGHSASNLGEQLKHLQTATGAQRDNLLKAIPYQMARLANQ
jgi:hypothetical protein